LIAPGDGGHFPCETSLAISCGIVGGAGAHVCFKTSRCLDEGRRPLALANLPATSAMRRVQSIYGSEERMVTWRLRNFWGA
jgi:hypothetical protein